MEPEQVALVRAIVDAMNLDAPTVGELRESLEAIAGQVPAPDGVVVEPVEVAGRPAEWIHEPDSSSAVLLYFHGGAFCSGSLNTHRNLAGRLAIAYGGRVLSLDYRLAPEHPFPAAVTDAAGAYEELLDSGLERSSIGLAGDSAGGGLTVAALLAIRDRGLPQPGAAVALSPWADLRQVSETYESRDEVDLFLNRARLDRTAVWYLGDTAAADPLASPVLADLGGLAPLLIQVGDREVLLDDSRALAERADRSGTEVELEVWDDMIHVWQAFPEEIFQESKAAVDGIGSFLRRHLG